MVDLSAASPVPTASLAAVTAVTFSTVMARATPLAASLVVVAFSGTATVAVAVCFSYYLPSYEEDQLCLM